MIGIKGIAKKPITDATASSNDVVNGKIFYNNNGVQTGKLSDKLVLNQISLRVPKGEYEFEYLDSDSGYRVYKSSVNEYTLADNSKFLLSFCNPYNECKIKGKDITCNIPLTSLEYVACNDYKYRIANLIIDESFGNGVPSIDLTSGKYMLFIERAVIEILNGKIVRAGAFTNISGFNSSDLTISIIYHKN